jgi:hypothetical protein
VLQEAEEAPALNEYAPPPVALDANMEIFLEIFWLPQEGQLTSLRLDVLRTSSSNGWLHSLQTNSKSGISCSFNDRYLLQS